MHVADWKYKKAMALVPVLSAKIENIYEKLNKKIDATEQSLITKIEDANIALDKHTGNPHAFGGDYEESSEKYIRNRHPKP